MLTIILYVNKQTGNAQSATVLDACNEPIEGFVGVGIVEAFEAPGEEAVVVRVIEV